MNLLKLLKKPVLQPLPTFIPITLENIPTASILVFYGGTKLTELAGNRLYGHPYNPAAFHAAFYIENGLFLNVGAFKTIQALKNEFRSTRRIDVIVDKYLLPQERKQLCYTAALDATEPKVGLNLPNYSATDFLRFAFRFLKPSKKQFCSENVVELFETVGRKVSDLKAVDTAPWDLLEYAMGKPDFQIYTLHEGIDFKKKYN